VRNETHRFRGLPEIGFKAAFHDFRVGPLQLEQNFQN
jgi:hypothetical protein